MTDETKTPPQDKRKLAFGVYEASPEFQEISQHSCVCYEDDLGLVALTGPAGDKESEEYAELFSAAPEMLDALETMARYLTDPATGDISECIKKVGVALIKAGVSNSLIDNPPNYNRLIEEPEEYPNWMINERDEHERHEAND